MVGATQVIRVIAGVTGLVLVLGSNRFVDTPEADAQGVAVAAATTVASSTSLDEPTGATTTVTVATTAPAATVAATTDSTTSTVPFDPDLADDERFVDALSRIFLLRPALPEELADASDGLTVEQRAFLARTAVEASPWAETNSLLAYGSVDAFDAAGSAEAYVDSLYLEAFGRAPDVAGRTFWVRELEQGASPADVVEGFRASEEFRRARVDQVFHDVLGRDPDPSGAAYWTERLLEDDEVVLAIELASSPEFYDRALAQEV